MTAIELPQKRQSTAAHGLFYINQATLTAFIFKILTKFIKISIIIHLCSIIYTIKEGSSAYEYVMHGRAGSYKNLNEKRMKEDGRNKPKLFIET